MSSQTLPKRSEVPRDLTWDLESVYATDADWEADFARITEMIPGLTAFKGELCKNADKLQAALALRDRIGEIMGRLYVYANMRMHEDTTAPTYQALASRAATLQVSLSSAGSYMTPELLATEPARIEEFMKSNKELAVSLFVAEVASICNEMLLTDYLLKNSSDVSLQMYVINHALDGFRATMFRQTLFAEFERNAHARAEAGEALTPELLCSIYKELNQKYYGAVVTLDDLVEIEWARIPHFYSSFYVYQYATGISAAVALSQQIIKEGQPAVERYLRFLSGGSSKDSLDLLKDAGVDLSSPAPIQQALDVFESYIAEFEKLATKQLSAKR